MSETSEKKQYKFIQETNEKSGQTVIKDEATGIEILTFSKKAEPSDIAASFKFINTLRKKASAWIRKQIDEKKYESGQLVIAKKVLAHYEAHGEPEGAKGGGARASQFQPKVKSADNCSDRAKAFKDRMTAKEHQIATGVIGMAKSDGKKPTVDGYLPDTIAKAVGMTVNQVNGAVSVLIAKGYVETERVKLDGKIVKIVRLTQAGVDATKGYKPEEVKEKKSA